MTTRQRVPTAIILVGSAFAAIGIALACGAIFVLRYRSGASTMLMVLVTFGWAIQARSVPIERASIKGSLRLKPAATRETGRRPSGDPGSRPRPTSRSPPTGLRYSCSPPRSALRRWPPISMWRPRHAGRCVRQSWHRILHGKLGKAGASAARRGV